MVGPSLLVSTDFFSDEEGNLVQASHYGLSSDWPSETLLTVTFAEHDGKTRLTLQQSVLESVAECHGAWQGWTETLDRPAEHLARTTMTDSSSAHAASERRRVRLLGAAALGLLRYGLAAMLVMSGSLKFLALAAEGIEPLVSNSPLLAWLNPLLGPRGTSALNRGDQS